MVDLDVAGGLGDGESCVALDVEAGAWIGSEVPDGVEDVVEEGSVTRT